MLIAWLRAHEGAPAAYLKADAVKAGPLARPQGCLDGIGYPVDAGAPLQNYEKFGFCIKDTAETD